MRNILFLILFLTIFSASPRSLSPEEAYARVLSEMGETRRQARGMLSQSEIPAFRAVSSQDGIPRIYLFDMAESFCIASADDVALPVLAYGDSPLPSADEFPPALTEWLAFYAREIAAASEGKVMETTAADDSRKAAAYAPLASVDNLITSKWNQISPYYDKCPIYSGNVRCVTGCTATAVAQIMFRHKFPEKGIGVFTHSDEIQGKEYSWTVDFGNTTYQWNKMTPTYNSKSSAAAKEAVAVLMQHLGVAMKMDYDYMGVNQSGASLINAAIGLIRNFGYSRSMRYELRSYYSLDEWKAMLHAELSAGRPLLHEGNSAGSSGHAFICDGYDAKSDKFHFNWGWSGNGDGYYALSALKPATTSGIGGGNYNYTENQAAVFGIRPPEDADWWFPLLRTYGDVTVKTPVVSAGEMAVLNCVNTDRAGFFSYTPSEEMTKFMSGLELSDKTTGTVWYLSSADVEEVATLYGKTSLSFYCDTSAVPAGDYEGRPVVKSCDDDGNPVGAWEYVRIPYGSVSSLEVHVGKHYVAAHNSATSAPLLTAEIVSFPEQLDYMDEFFVEADVKCSYADYSGAIVVAAYGDSSIPSVTLGQSDPLVIKAGETRRVRIPLRLSQKVSGPLELVLKARGTPFCDGPVVAVDNSVGELGFLPDDSWPATLAPGERFTLSGQLYVEGAPLAGYAGCRILDEEDRVVANAARDSYFNLAPGKTTKVTFSFDGLPQQGTYWVEVFCENQVVRVAEPIVVSDPEFALHVEYEEEITEDDWYLWLQTTLTLLSGPRYDGYLFYELTGPDGFRKESDYGNYLSLSAGDSSDSSFIVWTDDLDFGDYQFHFFLRETPFSETHLPVGDVYSFTKVQKAGINFPSALPSPTLAINPDGTLTITNIPPDAPLSIHTSDGLLVYRSAPSGSSARGSDFTLALSPDLPLISSRECSALTLHLSPGLYIARIGSHVLKFRI